MSTRALFVCSWLLVAHAAAQDPLHTLYFLAGDAADDELGRALQGVGDVDGDGRSDVAVGAPGPAGSQAFGFVRVYSGLDGSPIWTLAGAKATERLGAAVDAAGDSNLDGFPDLVAGGPFGTTNTGRGRALVLSGPDGAILRTLKGAPDEYFFGASVAGAGDLDGDGSTDIAVGAPGWISLFAQIPGRVHVFRGSDGSSLYTLSGTSNGDFFGTSVAAAGDVNGDGSPDLIAGALGTSVGTSYAKVFSGLDGSEIRTFIGQHDTSADLFGQDVAGVGDLDLDGFDEVVVGDAGGVGPNGGGYVRLFSGVTGALIQQFDGDAGGDALGYALSGLGDLSGDGIPDWIAGAPQRGGGFHPPSGPGYARVFSGLDGSVLAQLDGVLAFDEFGSAVASAGDANGDGVADLLVGAPAADPAGGSSGSVRASTFKDPALAFGVACGGLAVGSTGVPAIGSTGFAITVDGGPPTAPALVFAGASATQWGTIPLPLDLGPSGAPGCTLYVSPDTHFVTVLDGAGSGAVSVPIGPAPAAVGAVVHGQWAVLDPPANPLAFTLSDRLEVTIQPCRSERNRNGVRQVADVERDEVDSGAHAVQRRPWWQSDRDRRRRAATARSSGAYGSESSPAVPPQAIQLRPASREPGLRTTHDPDRRRSVSNVPGDHG